MPIGILGAMKEEVSPLIRDVAQAREDVVGGRAYRQGSLYGKDVVCTWSWLGKVASATTVTTLLTRYHVDTVLFVGVAAAVSDELSIGDVVVPTELVQHDLDCEPIIPRFQVWHLGISRFTPNARLLEATARAAQDFLEQDLADTLGPDVLASFRIVRPRVVRGLLASGDQFIATQEELHAIRSSLDGILCVEMEGAAVAQVCHEHQVPFAVVRAVSDRAGPTAEDQFLRFLTQAAGYYCRGIVRRLLPLI